MTPKSPTYAAARRCASTLAAALVLSACVNTTGGERVTFDARVTSAMAPTEVDGTRVLTWDDPSGRWTLTEARVFVGPVYLWSDEPLLDPGVLGSLQRLLGPLHNAMLPAAHAQAVDQFEAGFLRGEVTEQIAVDLTEGGPWHLGSGEGIAGPVRSGELWLEPVRRSPTLTLAGTLEPAAALHEDDPSDTAIDADPFGAPIPFAIALTITPEWVPGADEAKPVLLRRVRGLLLEGDLQQGAQLTVRVDAQRWLQGVNADDLRNAPTEDGVHQLTPTSRAGLRVAALLRRTGTQSGWGLTLTPEHQP